MLLDYKKFENAKLHKKPFEYLVIVNCISPKYLQKVIEDFPKIKTYGSMPLSSLSSGEHFTKFMEELEGEKFRKMVSKKFDVSLKGRPTMITARGMCKPTNGKIHFDSKGKILTFLVYMNENWPESAGGKLRLLNNGDDIEDYFVEIPPKAGTMIAFKCSENAWHGHKPFSGVRKSIQLNWVQDKSYLEKERTRHTISAFLKKLKQRLFAT